MADDVVPSWSSRGLGRNPDLVAPGRSIASLRDPNSALDLAHPEARVGDDLLKGSGTSQAAAVVSGAVALLLERRPDLTPDQVKAIVKSSADPLSGPGADAQGAGRLNVMRALAAASPDPASVRQPFQPAAVRGIVAKLVAGLSKGRQAEVGSRRPRRLELGRRASGAAPRGAARSGAARRGAAPRGAARPGAAPRGAARPGAAPRGAAPRGAARPGATAEPCPLRAPSHVIRTPREGADAACDRAAIRASGG